MSSSTKPAPRQGGSTAVREFPTETKAWEVPSEAAMGEVPAKTVLGEVPTEMVSPANPYRLGYAFVAESSALWEIERELGVPVDPYQLEDPYVSTGLGVYGPAVSTVYSSAQSGQSRPLAGRTLLRAGVWAVPAAGMALAIASLWTTPRLGQAPTVASPGSWLVMTVVGLILALIGVLCLTGLLAPTPGRHWALGSLLSMLIGTVVLAPVLGVVGLGWPSADQVGANAALAAYQSSPDGGPVLRWLGVGGLLLIGLSWALLAIGLAASRVYSTTDGVLVVLAVLLAVLAIRIEVLEVAASIMLLAAGLGLARTAARTRT